MMSRKGILFYKTLAIFNRVSSLGIDDLEKAGGKTIHFQDSESGVHFTATISDGATKQEILDSFNQSTFYWGYIDMSTTENARLGYSASSLTNTITNTAVSPVDARAVSVNKIYDELFIIMPIHQVMPQQYSGIMMVHRSDLI